MSATARPGESSARLLRRMLRAGLALALIVTPAAWGSPEATDEEFIRSLESETASPVDLKRLARLFFSVASTLDGGKSTVNLLRGTVTVRDPATAESVRATVQARYAAYERSVSRFKSAVSELLDAPQSRVRLYEVLTAGHFTCWELDGYTRLVDAYGATSADLISILSSTEGCELFRRTAFHRRIEGLIGEALADPRSCDGDVRELREELRALEDLLEDLRRIDEEE